MIYRQVMLMVGVALIQMPDTTAESKPDEELVFILPGKAHEGVT